MLVKTAGNLSILFDVGKIFGGVLASYISDKLKARATTSASFMYASIPAMLLYQRYGSTSKAVNIFLMIIVGLFVHDLYGQTGGHSGIILSLSARGVIASILVVACLFWAGLVDQVGFQTKGTVLNLSTLPVANVHLMSFGICIVLYVGVVVLGYTMFRELTQAQFILNMPQDSSVIFAFWIIYLFQSLYSRYSRSDRVNDVKYRDEKHND